MKEFFKHQENHFIMAIILIMIITVQTFFACSQEGETAATDGERLTLSAQTGKPLTRATYDETGFFAAGAEISVAIEKVVSGNPGTDGTYTFTADGNTEATFSTAAALYWNDFAGGINARAWYPAGAYSFPKDQSTAIKLATADYLFAAQKTNITKATFNDADKKFTFLHRTAMVKATLVPGTVAILDGATVTFYGYTKGTPSATDGSITGNTIDAITPWNNGDVHTALLIPKTYTDENFLKVTIGNRDYYWKPTSQQLAAGNSYALEITVNESALSVSVTDNGATWEPGNTQTVSPEWTVIDVSRSDISGGVGWTYENNTFTVTQFGAYTFTGASGQNKIKVNPGVTAFITLDGVVLTNGNLSAAGANVQLQIEGGNSLKGVHIPSGSAITIYGTGSLETANDVYGGAGIGGENGQAGGAITINGGTITARGGSYGAGIGGGYQGGGGTITINGGKVTAIISSQYGGGAGIGCGRSSGNNAIIAINGGTVSATGGDNDIGYGDNSGSGGSTTITGGSVLGTGGTNKVNPQPKNSSGEVLWRTKLTVGSVGSGTPVTALTIRYNGVSYPYNFKDMEIGSSNDVYLWLPAGSNVNVSLMAGGQTYSNTNVTVTNNHNNSATLNQ